ncbi:MAG: outer membrane lipoprotein chaperone LolA [Deltaproteobacteria bacterium]|nr:outer membrane lipoprotein chaperone LolA [Deltaproteobacteria bacterium]
MVKRNKFFLALFFLPLIGLWPSPGLGQALPLEEVVAKVQEQYEIHADFKASFTQESLIKSLGKKQHAEGAVYFKKPGKMRWIYRKPNKHEMISDGKTLWMYRPEDKQVVVSKMTQAFQSKAPSTFLAGIGNLKKDFQARFVKEPSPSADYFLELTPIEAQGGLEKLFLAVERNSFKIMQANIQDAMGNVTQITFSRIQFNNNLSDSLFNFTPPKDVEVFTLPGSAPAGGAGK